MRKTHYARSRGETDADICVYDSKTGDGTMSHNQMLRYAQEALLFRPGTTRVFVIPLYTKL